MPAALTMAQLLAEFRLCARGSVSPAAVLKTLNTSLVAQSPSGTFCTMCYLILHLETGKVLCANAGHHPVIGVGQDGVRVFGDASGPPAGILPECPWEGLETTIASGDTLLMFTDGIVEARAMRTQHPGTSDYDEYGMDRLCEVVKGHHRQTPRELIERVNRKVQAYCAPMPPHDDCTMMAVKYLG